MNQNLVNRFWQKARRAGVLTGLAPFVCLVGVTGSLAWGRVSQASDIDFFIIARRKRLWTARFIVVILLKLAGFYRSGNLNWQKAGKICPNWYITDSNLAINPNLPHPVKKLSAKQYFRLIPLYDEDGLFGKLSRLNPWITTGKNQFEIEPIKLNSILLSAKNILQSALNGKLGDCFEGLVKNWQLKKISATRGSAYSEEKDPAANWPDPGIFLSDDELRFHPKRS